MKVESFVLLFIILSFISDISAREQQQLDNLKLQLIQVLFRHGARTPSEREAGLVGVRNASIYKPPAFNQLTNSGKNQAYTLGRKLRARYDDFLGGYVATEVQALTSNHDRTKMSLQLALAGLYPPRTPDERWNEDLDWSPIPYSHHDSSGESCDRLFEPYACSTFDKLHRETIANSSEHQERLARYADFLQRITDESGIPFRTNLPYYVGWTLAVMEHHRLVNLSLPSWCSDRVFESLAELNAVDYDGMSLTDELKRLNGGTMLRRTIESSSSNGTKLRLYSAHDLTLAAFARAQGLDANASPTFGSAFVVEKLKDERAGEFVRIVSWDGLSDDFSPVRIGNCGEVCPMERYLEMVENVIPSDEDLEFLR